MHTYYLGVDWGTQNVGLAIADGEIKIASRIGEVSRSKIKEKINQLKDKHNFAQVILGINEANRKRIEKLKKEVESIGLKVELENEDFSTRLAHSNLKDAEKKQISKKDDSEAARIVLQSWLDRRE